MSASLRVRGLLDGNSYMIGDVDRTNMKKEKEIDADTATLLTRNYFEKGGDAEAKSAEMSLADKLCLTIASVERHSKHFIVKCELYEDPSSNTKSKYRLKISKKGEIEEVNRQTKKDSPSPFEFSRRQPREKTKSQDK